MKLKRYISLLLLAVYLFAAAGTAYASLTCSCHGLNVETHLCCGHCNHSPEAALGGASFRSVCCSGHQHSNEVDLYTGSSNESQKNIRCIVLDLPPALTVECPSPTYGSLLCEKAAERCAPFVREACVLPSGFRAPPVLA